MNKKDLPVVALQALNRVNSQLWELAENRQNIIERTFNEQNLVVYSDIDEKSKFKFELTKISVTKGSPIFVIELSPSSPSSNEFRSISVNEKQLIQQFNMWLGFLGVYERSFLTPEEEFFKKYQEEFFTEFEIIDEDSDTSTFDVNQQLLLEQYLKNMESKLLLASKENEEVSKIVTDINHLRSKLGKESKKKIIKQLSSIFAKLRQTSIKLLGEFYTVAKKEMIKKMINGGIDDIFGLIG